MDRVFFFRKHHLAILSLALISTLEACNNKYPVYRLHDISIDVLEKAREPRPDLYPYYWVDSLIPADTIYCNHQYYLFVNTKFIDTNYVTRKRRYDLQFGDDILLDSIKGISFQVAPPDDSYLEFRFVHDTSKHELRLQNGGYVHALDVFDSFTSLYNDVTSGRGDCYLSLFERTIYPIQFGADSIREKVRKVTLRLEYIFNDRTIISEKNVILIVD